VWCCLVDEHNPQPFLMSKEEFISFIGNKEDDETIHLADSINQNPKHIAVFTIKGNLLYLEHLSKDKLEGLLQEHKANTGYEPKRYDPSGAFIKRMSPIMALFIDPHTGKVVPFGQEDLKLADELMAQTGLIDSQGDLIKFVELSHLNGETCVIKLDASGNQLDCFKFSKDEALDLMKKGRLSKIEQDNLGVPPKWLN